MLDHTGIVVTDLAKARRFYDAIAKPLGLLTVDNGPHGGNMDVQEITTGNTVMFRVNKDGAHLFMGDCHAIQGDGECNGMGAIEIATTLTVKVSLEKAPRRLNHPRIETPTHICTLGCARPLEDAMRTVARDAADRWDQVRGRACADGPDCSKGWPVAQGVHCTRKGVRGKSQGGHSGAWGTFKGNNYHIYMINHVLTPATEGGRGQ